MIKFFIGLLVAGAAFYFIGWGSGYDFGYKDAQHDIILSGNITCTRIK